MIWNENRWGGEVGYLCFYIWMRSVLSCGNRSLIGRQLRVESFGRSGAAVEIGLGGRYEAIQGVWACLSVLTCSYFVHGRGWEISSLFAGEKAWNLRWRVQQKEDWEIWLDKADWGFAFLESHQLGAPDQPGHPCSVLGVSLFMIHELCGLRLQPLCRRSCIPIINYLLIECTSTYDMYSLHTQ